MEDTKTRTVSRSTADLSTSELKEQLQQMDDYGFEHLVADLWEIQGWKTTVKQQSNDGGVDVVAERSDPFPQKWLIQAKCYSNSLGGPELRQYVSLQYRDGVDGAIVISTAGFTNSAHKESQQQNLKLISGDDLIELIDDIEAYNTLDQYDTLKPDPLVETIPIAESGDERSTESDERNGSNPLASDDTHSRNKVEAEKRSKERAIADTESISDQSDTGTTHDLSAGEISNRVRRISEEGVHPLWRAIFSMNRNGWFGSNSNESDSVWEGTKLDGTGADLMTSRYVNRAFGGKCPACGAFASLRDISGKSVSRKAECIDCGSQFESQSPNYNDSTDWKLIVGRDNKVGKTHSLGEWKQSLTTHGISNQNRTSRSAEESADPSVFNRFDVFLQDLSNHPEKYRSDRELLRSLAENPPQTKWWIAIIVCIGYWLLWTTVQANILAAGLVIVWPLLPIAIYKDVTTIRKYVPDWKLDSFRWRDLFLPTWMVSNFRMVKWFFVGVALIPVFGVFSSGLYLLLRWRLGRRNPDKERHKRRILELADWEYPD